MENFKPHVPAETDLKDFSIRALIVGSLFGIVVFFGTAGGAVGPIVAGQIFDVTGSYTLAFWMISGIIIVTFALLQLLKPVAG